MRLYSESPSPFSEILTAGMAINCRYNDAYAARDGSVPPMALCGGNNLHYIYAHIAILPARSIYGPYETAII